MKHSFPILNSVSVYTEPSATEHKCVNVECFMAMCVILISFINRDFSDSLMKHVFTGNNNSFNH